MKAKGQTEIAYKFAPYRGAAVVTGAGSGIGKEIARALAWKGTAVAACRQSRGLLSDLPNALRLHGETGWRAHHRRSGWGDDVATVKAEVLKDLFKNPSGRFGDAQEIGRMVALLSSPLMGYANGADFRIDGGRVPTVN